MLSNSLKVFNSKFCMTPWTNLDVSPSGDISPCCKFSDRTGFNVNNHSIEEYYNSNFLQTLKQEFLEGKQPAGCKRCWLEESNGVESKRILDTRRWEDAHNNHRLTNSSPVSVSLALGNICNLKCRICGPTSSSAWVSEYKTLFPLKPVPNRSQHYQTPQFLNSIKQLGEQIVHIDFPGGEPFYTGIAEQITILDYLISLGRANEISLHYTTNGTIFPDDKFWKRWRHFKNVDVQLSIDGIEKHFEYNRHPATWKVVYPNIKKYQATLIDENHQLSVAHTLSIFTIFYLPEFLLWAESENLPLPWVGRLHRPSYYSPGVAPSYAKNAISVKLSNTTWANEVYNNDCSELFPEFLNIVSQQDRYRQESFENTFPELYKILKEQ